MEKKLIKKQVLNKKKVQKTQDEKARYRQKAQSEIVEAIESMKVGQLIYF